MQSVRDNDAESSFRCGLRLPCQARLVVLAADLRHPGRLLKIVLLCLFAMIAFAILFTFAASRAQIVPNCTPASRICRRSHR